MASSNAPALAEDRSEEGVVFGFLGVDLPDRDRDGVGIGPTSSAGLGTGGNAFRTMRFARAWCLSKALRTSLDSMVVPASRTAPRVVSWLLRKVSKVTRSILLFNISVSKSYTVRGFVLQECDMVEYSTRTR